MKLLLASLLVLALVSLTSAVVISWEESLEGKIDYRFFYLTMPPEDSGIYDKPTFGLVNGIDAYEYGALGSLTCSSSGLGIAVYYDSNNDDLKEWRCLSINVLPFAGQPTAISPPICGVTVSDGVPAQWNATSGEWVCGDYNQVLTLSTRLDGSQCQTADFLQYYGVIDAIRCVSPNDINPADTDQSSSKRDEVQLAERVDITADKKWFTIMTDYDITTLTSRPWNYWRWQPFMNYDSSPGSSLISTPPKALPFNSSLLAVTVASFKVSSYTFVILAPTGSNTLTISVSKLSAGLSETTITNSLVFDSVSATSGQVTYSLSGNAQTIAAPGEAFVGGVSSKTWGALPQSSDRHMVALTFWIQTLQSFTSFFPLA